MSRISVCVWVLCVLSTPAWGQSRFNCSALPPLPRPAPTVHELHPQDIKVVMALGDSITAGFSMLGNSSNPINVLADITEYRGLSWSMGVDDGAVTMPNFLRTYTPDLIGGSVGRHLAEMCRNGKCPANQYQPEKDVFNAAQSGAVAPNLVSHEFSYLLKQLKTNKKVDMQNDWKLLTVFIGVNDVCQGCSGNVSNLTVDDYDRHLREVLKEVESNIPKVFVNLILIGNISEIYTLSLKNKYCTFVHRLEPAECPCAFSGDDNTRQEMDEMSAAINARMRKIAADYANKNDGFAVVVQPFMSQSSISSFPIEYLSKFDCFHPSLLAHQSMAVALWNNMITPAADKQTTFTIGDMHAKCPTASTLLYTN